VVFKKEDSGQRV